MSNNDVFPARHMEHSVAIPALFQAVKSYLHFSQLSAWLNQTRGSAPKSVEYRYFTLPNPSGTDMLGSQVRRVQVLCVYAATLHIHVHY